MRAPGSPLAPLAVLLLLALAVLGFLAAAAEVREGPAAGGLDAALLRVARRPGEPAVLRGPPWMLPVTRDLTALGSIPVLALVTTAVAGFLAVARRRRTLALVLAATVGGFLLMAALKAGVGRARPDVVPRLAPETSPSFPSGHALMSAVTYLTLGTLLAQLRARRRERVYVLGVAVALTALVGVTRVMLGVHWPSDVVAGWCLGLAWALASGLVARALRRRSARLRAEVPEAEGAATESGPGEGPGRNPAAARPSTPVEDAR